MNKQKLKKIFDRIASPEDKADYELKQLSKRVEEIESTPTPEKVIEKTEVIKEIENQTGEQIVEKINALEIEPTKQVDFTHIRNFPWHLVKDKHGDLISWGGTTLQTEGVANDSQTLLNLIAGTGITVTDNGSGEIEIISTGGGHTIKEEGTSLTQRTNLNFIGASVTATDNAGTDSTDVTITGGTITGTDTQVLFFDGANNPAGDAGLLFNKTTDILTVAGSVATPLLTGISGAQVAIYSPLLHDASFRGTFDAVMDLSLLTGSRNFAFPNASGTFALASDLTAYVPTTTTITVAGTANQITSSAGAQDLSANRTWTLSLPADVLIPTVLTVPNTGLHLLDTNASHDLIIKPGSDLTADKTLTITTGDADVILNLTAVTDEYVLAYDVATNTWRGVVASGGGNSFTTIVCPTGTDPVADSATDSLELVAGSSKITITGDSALDAVTFDVVESALTLSNLGGAVTDAQVPNTITLDNITQITTRSHASLQNLTSADDHTQYLLLAGRSGGQAAIGGTASGNNLTLESTSHATKGSVRSKDNFIIGNGVANVDYTLTFDGETNDGVLGWYEDEDYFGFNDDVAIFSNEKLYFRDTGIFAYSDADGSLIIESDTNATFRGNTLTTIGVAGEGILGDSTLRNWYPQTNGKIQLGTSTKGFAGLLLAGETAVTIGQNRNLTANTAGTALTLQSAGATVGATNKVGGDLLLYTGLGTGNSRVANIALYAPASGTASGTSDQALVSRIIANGVVSLTSGVAATIATLTIAAGQMAGCLIIYTVKATNGTDMIAATGQVDVSLVLKSTTYTGATSVIGTEAQAKSDATDTISNTFAFAASSGNLQITSTIVGMTATTFRITYCIIANSDQDISIP